MVPSVKVDVEDGDWAVWQTSNEESLIVWKGDGTYGAFARRKRVEKSQIVRAPNLDNTTLTSSDKVLSVATQRAALRRYQWNQRHDFRVKK